MVLTLTGIALNRQFWKLTWRPSKTGKTTNKKLSIRVLPELQAALDAMPRTDALTFLLSEHGRPFKSAQAFCNRFADWAKAAGLKPVLCDDGKVRSYRAHGLRKAACTRMAHRGCSAIEIMSVSGHKTLAEAQKYITAVEQERMAEAAMAKVAAGSKRAQAVTDAQKSGTDGVENAQGFGQGGAPYGSRTRLCGVVAPHRGGEPRARGAAWGTLSWFSAARSRRDPQNSRKRLTMAVGETSESLIYN